VSKAPPALLEPAVAGKLLEKALGGASGGGPKSPLTIADAAAKSGLALRDAERGLHWLSAEYRGALRVTDQGELLFVFPHGFAQPWVTRDATARFFQKAGKVLAGVGRFVVRAWLTIVLLAYVGIFLAAVIGLTVAQSNNNNRSRGGFGGGLIYVVLRVLADALFWTFHPFSPFAYRSYGYGYGDDRSAFRPAARKKSKEDDVPFYEKVNRFFFGPTQPEVDPREQERRILAEIRANRGRVGLADVMRVTGLPREQVDPMMARLMVDYDGDVSVSTEGGITYQFEALRKTAQEATEASPEPAWNRTPQLPPLTGNEGGTNFLIVLLNGFNLVMSLVALGNDLTIHNLLELFQPPRLQHFTPGVPIALGIVPLVFSAALFLIPIVRAALRPSKAKKIAKERGRLALLRVVLNKIGEKQPITEPALVTAYRKASGLDPDDKELTRELVRLGGDVQIEPEGGVRYRFADLETEAAALEAEREAAAEDEKRPGKVVFSSDE
jgi:hypothetical protein